MDICRHICTHVHTYAYIPCKLRYITHYAYNIYEIQTHIYYMLYIDMFAYDICKYVCTYIAMFYEYDIQECIYRYIYTCVHIFTHTNVDIYTISHVIYKFISIIY